MATYTIDKFAYSGNTYNLKDANAMPKTGGTFTGEVTFNDTVTASDVTADSLVVQGNTSIVNGLQVSTINGVTVGSSPKFTDTDTKVTLGAVTSGTTYYPVVGSGTTAATRQFDTTGFAYAGTNGTTSAIGTAKITLGNSTASGTANNKRGQVVFYGSNANYTTLQAGTPSSSNTLTLPTGAGTIPYLASGSGTANSIVMWDETDTNKLVTGPTFGDSEDTFLRNDGEWAEPPSGTDKKVEIAAVTSGTTYYPIVGTGTTAATRQYDADLIYVGTNGTTSSTGSAKLTLGNNKTSTTANNKQGQIILYGSTAYATTITPGAPSAARTITLPNATGTLALTSQIPAMPTTTDDATTGISIADHSTTSLTGVGGITTVYSKSSGGNGSAPTLGTAFTVPNVTSAGSASTWSFTDVTVPIRADSATSIPNVTSAGTASSWTFEEKSIPNVTSAGSASSWTFESKSIPNVTAVGSGSFTSGTFSGGSGSFSATVTNHVLSFSHTHTAATHGTDSHTHTAPTLGTAITVYSKSGGSNGTAPTLGTAIKVQSKSGGSNGTAPTLGTAISIYGVKSGTNSTTTASKASGANGTAPTLGTAFTIPNVTSAGSASTWAFESKTVATSAASATTVVTGKSHTITDNGHSHDIS